MSQSYKAQLAKGIALKDIKITNNKIFRETLDWMIVRSEKSQFMTEQFVLDLKALKNSEQLNYLDFLRLSHEFSYRIEGRTNIDFQSYFSEVSEAQAIKSFLFLPSQVELTAVHLNEMLAESIMPLGLIDAKIMADGREMTPSAFFKHDLGHAWLASGARAKINAQKFKSVYWNFKAKINDLSAKDQHVLENIWFMLTHELPHSANTNQEMARAVKIFTDPADTRFFDYLHLIHDKQSDLKPLPKEELRAYVEKLEKLLKQ